MDTGTKFLTTGTELKEKYVVGIPLGSGSFGITYFAFDKVLQQNVAIKEFFPAAICRRNGMTVCVSETDEEVFTKGKEKFKEEASLIFGNFDLPGICNIKDYFEENGTAYIVEEFLQGGTLAAYIKEKGRISGKRCLEMFRPVMEGLNRIHSMGIIHMDISPDNLMFDGEGNLKLIDFGAAKQVTSSDEDMALKVAYAPPEQYRDLEITGPWTDIYALCATMYQALTGVKPANALSRIKKDTVKPAADISDTDNSISEVITRGMSLDIRKRFFSCANMLAKLGLDTDESDNVTAKIRHLWGERWMAAVTEQKGDYEKAGSKRMSKRKIKRLIMTAASIALILALMAGGLALFVKLNPEKYFDYKLEKAVSEAELNKVQKIPEDSRLYKKIEKHAYADNANTEAYSIDEVYVKRFDLQTEGKYLFYLDRATIIKIIEYYSGESISEMKDVPYTFFRGSVIYTSNPDDALDIIAIDGAMYYWDTSSMESNVLMMYDVCTQRPTEIIITADRDICFGILKQVFPYLVPETYLTDDEINTFLDTADLFGSHEYNGHAKFKIRVEKDDESGGRLYTMHLSK